LFVADQTKQKPRTSRGTHAGERREQEERKSTIGEKSMGRLKISDNSKSDYGQSLLEDQAARKMKTVTFGV